MRLTVLDPVIIEPRTPYYYIMKKFMNNFSDIS